MNQEKSDESIHSTGNRSALDNWMNMSEEEKLKDTEQVRSTGRSALDDIKVEPVHTDKQDAEALDEWYKKHKLRNIKRMIESLTDKEQMQLIAEISEEWAESVIRNKKVEDRKRAEQWAEEEIRNAKMPGYTEQVLAMLDSSAVYHVTGEGVDYKGAWGDPYTNMSSIPDLTKLVLPEIVKFADEELEKLTGPAAIKQRTDTKKAFWEWLKKSKNEK